MHNSKFPRLYVEPSESVLPPVVTTMHFVGRRFPFGPCEVSRLFRTNGEDAETHVMPLDWHSSADAAYLAREILWHARGCIEGDVPERFAEEVLAKLPRDGWEMSKEEVLKWSAVLEARHLAEYPPRTDPDDEEELPGDLIAPQPEYGAIEDERLNRLKERLLSLGMIDSDGETDAGEGVERRKG